MTKKFTRLFSTMLLALVLLIGCTIPAHAANNGTTAVNEVLEFLGTESKDEIEARSHGSTLIYDLTTGEELGTPIAIAPDAAPIDKFGREIAFDLVPNHDYEIRTYFNNETDDDWFSTCAHISYSLPSLITTDNSQKYVLNVMAPAPAAPTIIVQASTEDIRLINEQYTLRSNTDVDGTVFSKSIIAYQPICTSAEALANANSYKDGCIEAHTYGYLSYTFSTERAHPSTDGLLGYGSTASQPTKDPVYASNTPDDGAGDYQASKSTPVPAKSVQAIPVRTRERFILSQCVMLSFVGIFFIFFVYNIIVGSSAKDTNDSDEKKESPTEQLLNQASSAEGDLPVDDIQFPTPADLPDFPEPYSPSKPQIRLTLNPNDPDGPPEGYPEIKLNEVENHKIDEHTLERLMEYAKSGCDMIHIEEHNYDENGICTICGHKATPIELCDYTPVEHVIPKPLKIRVPKKLRRRHQKQAVESTTESSEANSAATCTCMTSEDHDFNEHCTCKNCEHNEQLQFMMNGRQLPITDVQRINEQLKDLFNGTPEGHTTDPEPVQPTVQQDTTSEASSQVGDLRRIDMSFYFDSTNKDNQQ